MQLNELIYLIMILVVALVGWKMKMLSFSGFIGATFIGWIVFLGFHLKGIIVLGSFFLSSSFWSYFKKDRKELVQQKNEKSSERDLCQVLANGGIPAVISILFYIDQHFMWVMVFISSVAAANADTWASEIGTLSNRKPIHIYRFKKVEAGTSGAVTLLGTYSGLAGALFIAVIAFILWDEINIKLVSVVTIIGFLGNLIDTLIGATLQASYYCSICNLKTEKRVHCHQSTIQEKGFSWINNEFVNFSSILISSVITYVYSVITL